MRTDDGVVNQRLLDGPRLVVSAVGTAGLGVATAALFVHYYPRTTDVGPTAAALGDAFTWILGACVGLLIGSAATSFFVRRGSCFFAGMLAGIGGFWVGVLPYVGLTAPSDVSFSDALGFAVIAFVPAFVFVAAGAAMGAGLRRLLPQG
jgi:hypothetical protein